MTRPKSKEGMIIRNKPEKDRVVKDFVNHVGLYFILVQCKDVKRFQDRV